MMYAVVLQNAAEGQRLEDYERRVASQQERVEEDEEEDDEIGADAELAGEENELRDASLEHPQNSDIQSLLNHSERLQIDQQPDVDRSIDNINNQLNRNLSVNRENTDEQPPQSSLIQETTEV